MRDGKEVVIAYGGRKLSNQDQKYTTTERECLAVIAGLKEFEPYIRGQDIKILTDHAALKWILTQKHPPGRLARWIAYLQSFNFIVQHRPGKKLAHADCISRQISDDTGACTEIEPSNNIQISDSQIINNAKPPNRTEIDDYIEDKLLIANITTPIEKTPTITQTCHKLPLPTMCLENADTLKPMLGDRGHPLELMRENPTFTLTKGNRGNETIFDQGLILPINPNLATSETPEPNFDCCLAINENQQDNNQITKHFIARNKKLRKKYNDLNRQNVLTYPNINWDINTVRNLQLKDIDCKQIIDYLESILPNDEKIARRLLLVIHLYVMKDGVFIQNTNSQEQEKLSNK
jgi:hypothetical protein